MTDDLKQLRDTQEIMQLKARYCRCVDTKDWAGYANCLTDDARLAGDGGSVQNGREDVVAFVSTALAHATTVHHVHTPEITFTGRDTATVIWPMNDYVEIPLPSGDPFVLRGYGHYHEEYVRTSDGWRVQSSTVKRLRVDTEGEV
jgi:uncharacterized protein (TIGR02246 family)